MTSTSRLPADVTEPAVNAPQEQLGHRRLGAGSLVFLIIAASAPLTVLAGGVPSSFAASGIIGVPLGYVLLGVILALFAVGYGAMSAGIRNAGAFYAYIAAGLGIRQGIGASVLALVSYNAMQVGLYGIFGFALSGLLHSAAGFSLPWWAAALVGWAVVALMGAGRVDFSAKVVAFLVACEFAVVVVVDAMSLAAAPEGVTAAPLAPGNLFTGGIGAVLAFGVAAFMGFESGAVYSEEAREPRRSVPRATFIAVGIISIFYAISAWALAVGIGPSRIVALATEQGPDMVFTFVGQHGPTWLVGLSNLLFVTSLLAALLAFHNAAARYFFALGRTGVLPRFFDRTSPRTGAPLTGSFTQSAVGLLTIAVFAVAGRNSSQGPLFPVVTLFTWFCNAGAFGLVFLMAVTSVAVMAYFRGRPDAPGTFTRLVAPALATAGLGLIFVLILANFDLLIGSGSPVLITVMPGVILAAGVVGLLRGEYLRRHRPEVFRAAATELDEPA